MDMHELKEAVFNAADDIHADGSNPSVAAVAQSLNLDDVAPIVPMLQEWRIRLHLNQGATDEPGLWAALVHSLRPLEADFSEASAGGGTAEQLAAARAEATATVTGLSAELDRARSETERLRVRVEELEAAEVGYAELAQRVVDAEAAVNTARGACDKLQTEKEAMYATARAAETRAAEAEAARKRVEEMDRIAAATLKAAGDAREKAETDVNRLQSELEALRGTLETYRAAERDARAEAAEAARRLSEEGDWMMRAEDWPELPRQLAMATVRIASLRAERDGLRKHLDDTRDQLERAHQLLEIRLSQPAATVVAASQPAAPAPAPANSPDASNDGPRRKIEVVRRR